MSASNSSSAGPPMAGAGAAQGGPGSPNFHLQPAEVNDEFPRLKALGIAFLVITTVSYALRLYVKLRLAKLIKADDGALLLAYLLFWPMAVTSTLFGTYGARIDKADFSVIPDIVVTAKVYNATYALCGIACKLSVMLFVRSLLGPHDRWQRAAVYGITAAASVLGLLQFAFSFTCGQTNIQHDKNQCDLIQPSDTISLTWSVLNTVAELVYAGVCVLLVWRTSMPRRTRIVAAALLCFSCIGCVASALRVATIAGWGWKTFDAQSLQATRWSLIEIGVTISAICLASLRPLLQKLRMETGAYANTYKSNAYGNNSRHLRSAAGPGNQQSRIDDEIPLKIGVQTVFEVQERPSDERPQGNAVSIA